MITAVDSSVLFLLTRDAGFYRDYFDGLAILDPTQR